MNNLALMTGLWDLSGSPTLSNNLLSLPTQMKVRLLHIINLYLLSVHPNMPFMRFSCYFYFPYACISALLSLPHWFLSRFMSLPNSPTVTRNQEPSLLPFSTLLLPLHSPYTTSQLVFSTLVSTISSQHKFPQKKGSLQAGLKTILHV